MKAISVAALAPLLVRAGHEVVGLDSGLFVDCTYVGDVAAIPSINKDIRDVAREDLVGFDAVLHLANSGDRRRRGSRLPNRVRRERGTGQAVLSRRLQQINRVLPSFRPEWDVRRGAIELFEAHRRVGLTLEEFEGARFSRIKYLRGLLASGRLDSDLRWRTDARRSVLAAGV